MRLPDPRVPVHVLRSAAQGAVERQSTRTVAAAMGISAAGLRYFLKGGEPYRRTVRKLTAWYVRYGRDAPGLSPDVAEAALSTLVESVPIEVRSHARGKVLEALRNACGDYGYPPPAWVGAPPSEPDAARAS